MKFLYRTICVGQPYSRGRRTEPNHCGLKEDNNVAIPIFTPAIHGSNSD
jgi:hypothetical protein